MPSVFDSIVLARVKKIEIAGSEIPALDDSRIPWLVLENLFMGCSVRIPMLCPKCGQGFHMRRDILKAARKKFRGKFIIDILHINEQGTSQAEATDKNLELYANFVKKIVEATGTEVLVPPSDEEEEEPVAQVAFIFSDSPETFSNLEEVGEEQASQIAVFVLNPKSILFTEIDWPISDDDDEDDEEIDEALFRLNAAIDLIPTDNPTQSIYRGLNYYVLVKSSGRFDAIKCDVVLRDLALTFSRVQEELKAICINSGSVLLFADDSGKDAIPTQEIFWRGVLLPFGTGDVNVFVDSMTHTGSASFLSDMQIIDNLHASLKRSSISRKVNFYVTERVVDKTAPGYSDLSSEQYKDVKTLLCWQ